MQVGLTWFSQTKSLLPKLTQALEPPPLSPDGDLSLILANDLLPTACTSITRNIEYNDVHAIPYKFLADGVTPNDGSAARGKNRRKFKRGGVVVNQGDAK